uniref:Uncharacterized protein n=1 Tax=Arundo donax TaxID=35708 RepID=A0A0A8YC45_ARUDO
MSNDLGALGHTTLNGCHLVFSRSVRPRYCHFR